MKIFCNSGIVLGVSMSALALSGAAHAQSTGDNGDRDIIVTANKTNQAASKISQALSVFSGETIKEAGIVNVRGLQDVTPGLQVAEGTRGASVSIRGVTTTDTSSKGEQDIVFSIDGVPVGRPQLVGLAFFDIDRVEILRGPQGTLYGKSSTGGAINIITAKPKHEFAAEASAELGNYNTRRFNAMVNLPVTDTLALRVAATSNSREGFILPVLVNPAVGNAAPIGGQRNLDSEGNWAVRVTGKLDFAQTGSLVVTGTFGHNDSTNASGTVLYNRVMNLKGDNRFQVYYNPMVGNGGNKDNFANVNAELNFDAGPVHVAYDGAHQWWHGQDDNNVGVNNPTDAGGFTWENYSSHLTTDSHEIRLSNADPHARLEWLIGGTYYNEHNDESDIEWATSYNQNLVVPTGLTAGTYNCLATPMVPACNAPNPSIVGPNIHKAKGVFGQTGYHVTDRLKLTAGLRYSVDDMSRNAYLSVGPTGADGLAWRTAAGTPCGPLTAACGNATQSLLDAGANSTKGVTYRFGIDYQATPANLFYVSVASGYKGGGFNDVDPNAATARTGTYGAEHITAYEAGFKGKLLPNLSYNTDVYFYDYSKYQITANTWVSAGVGGNPVQVIYTILAPASMYGWENDMTWRATPHDTLTVTLALERAAFHHGVKVGAAYQNTVDWGGRWLDNAPAVSSIITYEHRWDLHNGGNLKLRASSKINGGYWESALGGTVASGPLHNTYTPGGQPQQFRQGAFTRTDLSLGYTTQGGKFQIEGWVKNLEDKVQIQNAPTIYRSDRSGDFQTVRVNLPRTFGARVTVKY